ncbi:MAG: alpha/beta fold hydrolase, partial [Cyanobacteria bacterium P01_H01_bin.119]
MKSWLSCQFSNPQATLRLFCFPYAGGSGKTVYRNWGQILPNTVEVCAIELPGHGSRLIETPLTDLTEIVTALAGMMQPLLDKPFACFGHSLGGLIAFELVGHLRQNRQIIPQHLWVSAARPPHLPSDKPAIHTL